jgi:hypothetical protein
MARTSILGKVAVSLGLTSKGFTKGLKSAELSLKRFGRNAENVGKNLSVGLTAPLVGFAAKSIQLFDKQAQAIAQVEAGLKSTGMAAGFTSKELQAMASSLQNNSLFGDEDILKSVTANLLTFTSISGEAFSRTQQAVLDLATRMDGDLKGATIQLGKALNDPVANLSALSRSGIQFSDSQKEMIKSLVESNKLAEAQGLILGELEKQFGGSAKAAAEAGLGGFVQLQNSIGDLMERVGKSLMPLVNRLTAFIQDLVKKFDSVSDSTITFGIGIGGIVAAIGPALLIIGKLVKGILILNTPLGLALGLFGAIALYVVNNWDKVSVQIVQVANKMIDLYNESAFVRGAFESIKATGVTAFKVLDEVLASFMDKLILSLSAINKLIARDFGGAWDDVTKWAGLVADSFVNLFKVSAEEGKKAIDNVVNQRVKLIDEDYVKNSVDALRGYIVKGLSFGSSGVSEQESAGPSVAGAGLNGMILTNKQLIASFEEIQTVAPQAIDAISPAKLENLNLLADSMAFGFDRFGDSIGRAFGDSVTGLNSFSEAFKNIGVTVKQVISQIIGQLVKLAAMRAFGVLLKFAGVPTGFLGAAGLLAADGSFFGAVGGATNATSPVTAGKQALNANLYIDGQNVRTSYESANRRFNRVVGS